MITLPEALKEALARTLAEMLQCNETVQVVVGYPFVKVSFVEPDGNTFKVLSGKDFPRVAGIKKEQKIYIYQET